MCLRCPVDGAQGETQLNSGGKYANGTSTDGGGVMLETAALLNANGRWPEDVSIWRLDMPLPYDSHLGQKRVTACYAVLDGVERGRADRYRVVGERVRYVTTRATLRHLLSAQTGVPASALAFTSVRNGRPALAEYPRLSFNVSHAGDHALIAISHDRVVGVDIEHIHPQTDWQSLVEMVCSKRQREQLCVAPGKLAEEAATVHQRRRFFQCWTAKEAILKALGIGLTDHLRRIDFTLDTVDVQRPQLSPIITPAATLAITSAVAPDTTRPVEHPIAQGIGISSEDPVLREMGNLSFHWLTDIDAYMGCIAYSDAVVHVTAGTGVG